MTILEAAVEVLKESGQSMPIRKIFDAITRKNLYQFGAKSPRSVLSGTLRNEVKRSQAPKVVEVSGGVYRAT